MSFMTTLRAGSQVALGEGAQGAQITLLQASRGSARVLVTSHPYPGGLCLVLQAQQPALSIGGAAVQAIWARRGEARLAINAPSTVRIRTTHPARP